MFFFIILSTILFFFCLYLYFDNKKLNQRIIELELETKKILERILINNKEDLISIENISKEINNKNTKITTDKKELKSSPTTNTEKQIATKYTARNTTTEYQEPKILPPIISILNQPTETIDIYEKSSNKKTNTQQKKYQKDNLSNNQTTNSVSISLKFDPSEFVKKNKRLVSEVKKTTHNNDYLTEISNQLKLAEELGPQTIELTDYEKNQEEEAIISYQELLSLKEKINNQEYEEENFVDDLKDFRSLLD